LLKVAKNINRVKNKVRSMKKRVIGTTAGVGSTLYGIYLLMKLRNMVKRAYNGN